MQWVTAQNFALCKCWFCNMGLGEEPAWNRIWIESREYPLLCLRAHGCVSIKTWLLIHAHIDEYPHDCDHVSMWPYIYMHVAVYQCRDFFMRPKPGHRIWLCKYGHSTELGNALQPQCKIWSCAMGHSTAFGWALWALAQNHWPEAISHDLSFETLAVSFIGLWKKWFCAWTAVQNEIQT